jgi:hypothetical protein
VETVGTFLRELGRREPELYTTVAPEVIRRYVERGGEGCCALTKADESSRRLPEAVTVLGALVQQFANTTAATLVGYQLLQRVLAEQCDVNIDASGTPTIQIKVAAEIPCESLQHPAAPDSSYNAHRGQGYAVQIMETSVEDDQAAGATPTDPSSPDLITHVAVQQMTHHDSQALAPALADVRSRQCCPARVLDDSHYGSTENIAQCQREGIALVAPAMPPKGTKQGQLTLEHFILDEVGRVVACPQGHAPVWTGVSEKRLAVRFAPAPCQGCPSMHQCPGHANSEAKTDARWQYTHARVAQRQRRLAAQEPAFKTRYCWRAGIEATMDSWPILVKRVQHGTPACRRRDDTCPTRPTQGADIALWLVLGAVTPGLGLHHRRHGAPGYAATGSTGGSAGAGAWCFCLASSRGASRKRRRRRSRRARPNICRFSILRRLMWPSTGLVLQGKVTPALTAS